MAGNVRLTWKNPTAYADGAPLAPDQIQGHRVEARVSASLPWHAVAEVEGPGELATVTDLPGGTWSFRVITLAGGEESDPSGSVEVQVPTGRPNPVTELAAVVVP